MPISSLLISIVTTAAAAAPDVQVATLDGAQHVGTLQALTATELTFVTEGQTRTLPAADLLAIRPTADRPAATERPVIDVHLVDGSVLGCDGFSTSARAATLVTPHLGRLDLPPAAVRSVRIGAMDSKVKASWDDLRIRETRTDLLVVRKGDALDFIDGVVGAVTDAAVTLLRGDRELPVPRERVFGVVYARAAPPRVDAVCELALAGGDRLKLRSITFADDVFSARLVAGPEVSPAVDQVVQIDFGLGRVRYLADLEETAAYEPVGLISSEFVQKLRKDRNSLGGPLKVGPRAYTRGLWLHSGTTVKYRLNRDYRRLQAVMGLERSSSECGRLNPQVRLVVLGDGQVLLEADVLWGEDPRALDLDVSGVRDLEVRVLSPGNTLGACEHLALAEARVIK